MRDVVVPRGTPQDTIEVRADELIIARPYANDHIEVYEVANEEDWMSTKEQRLRFRRQQRKFKKQNRDM